MREFACFQEFGATLGKHLICTPAAAVMVWIAANEKPISSVTKTSETPKEISPYKLSQSFAGVKK